MIVDRNTQILSYLREDDPVISTVTSRSPSILERGEGRSITFMVATLSNACNTT